MRTADTSLNKKKVHLKQVDIFGLGSGAEVDQKLMYANDLSSGVIFRGEIVNSCKCPYPWSVHFLKL
jgi:hypothetical protein